MKIILIGLSYNKGRLRTLVKSMKPKMKLTILLLAMGVTHVHAHIYAQKISIVKKNSHLKEIIEEIRKQSGYDFLYSNDLLKGIKPISVNISNASIEEALSKSLKGLPISFKIEDGAVLLKRKTASSTPDVKGHIASKKDTDLEQQQIHGRVLDDQNTPLESVSISNLTNKKGTSTDKLGNFTIEAKAGDVIQFTRIGYTQHTVTIAPDQQQLQIKLNVKSIQIEETVVTALGIRREERALGYAVSKVNGEELIKARETNVINSLAGKVPGLIINSTAGGPAGSSRVIIRGNTTVTGNNQPLYVVDGVPMDNSNYGGTGSGQYAEGFDMGDAISAINPDDIDQISVLKGPSASALYGTRAANGVILITTKKGSTNKALGIDFNSTSSFETQLTKYDGYQRLYGQGTKQNAPNSPLQARTTLFQSFGARLDPDLMIDSYDGIKRPYQYIDDNIGGFFRTGSTFSNNLAFTAGNETSSLRFSAADLRVNDIIPASGLRRNTFSLNGTSKFGSKLTLEARSMYLNENVKNRPALGDSPSNMGNAFIGLASNVSQSLFADTYKNPDGSYIEWGGGQYRLNPYWVINEMYNNTDKNRLMGAAQLNYTATPWFNLQGRASTDVTFLNFEKFSPPTTPGFVTGGLEQTDRKYVTTEADVLATLQKQVTPSLHVSLRLGGSISRVTNSGNVMQFTNMTVRDVITPTSFTDKNIVPVSYARHLNSQYGLLSLAYKSYLYLDASVRRDASSTLPQNNNSYVYPSLVSSFVFTDAFKLDKQVLSFGKLRASVAEVGGDTEAYLLDLYYAINPLPFKGQAYGGASTDVLPAKGLRPTRTRSFEVGTELKFFKDRIGLDFTYYNQKSRDQINRVPIPNSSGFQNRMINAGMVSNKGFEILLTSRPIVNENFKWDLSLNFARNRNMVESLSDGVPFLTLSDARWMSVAVVAKPKADYGSILAFDYQKDPNGNIILDPVTLLPLQSEERQVVGKGIYDWTGGVSSTMNYKNFNLSFIVDIKSGADMFSMSNLFAASRGSLESTLEGRSEWISSEEERQAAHMTIEQWTEAGKVRGLVPKGVIRNIDESGKETFTQNGRAVDPSIYWGQIIQDGGVASPYIYDASYVKMREIMIGYSIPSSLTKKWGLQQMQVSVVSRNPFIIYKNIPNIDPDSNYNNGNGQGLEYGSLPTRRSWGLNLSFKF